MNEEFLDNYIIENPHLTELIISNTYTLKAIPDSIILLNGLQHIHIKNVPNVKKLPVDVCDLTQLRSLSFQNTGIKRLDETLFKNSIEFLHLENTNIRIKNITSYTLHSLLQLTIIDSKYQSAKPLLNQYLPELRSLHIKVENTLDLNHMIAPKLEICHINCISIQTLRFLGSSKNLKKLELSGDLTHLKDPMSLDLLLRPDIHIHFPKKSFLKSLHKLDISDQRKRSLVQCCLAINASDDRIKDATEVQLFELSNLTERLAKLALNEISDRYASSWNIHNFSKIKKICIAGRLQEQSSFIKQSLKERNIEVTFKKKNQPVEKDSCVLLGFHHSLLTLPSTTFLTEIILLRLISNQQSDEIPISNEHIRSLLLSKQYANLHIAIQFLDQKQIDLSTLMVLVALYKLVNDQTLKRSIKKILTRYDIPNLRQVLSMKKKLKGNIPDSVRENNIKLYSQLLKDNQGYFIHFATDWLKSNNL